MLTERRTVVRRALRAIEGTSPAALWSVVTGDVSKARRIVGETLAAAHGRLDEARRVSAWDIVRGFALAAGDIVSVPGGGWNDGCTPLERYLLAQLVRFFAPSLLLEIGTFRGATTRLFLDNLPNDAKVCTIDLPIDDRQFDTLNAPSDARLIRQRVVGEDYRTHSRSNDVIQVFGSTFDSAVWARVPSGAQFVFIDASHTDEAVRNDSEHAMGCAAADAIYAWHDYTPYETPERGVGRYIQELMAAREDVFIVDETDLALRIPPDHLRRARKRVSTCFEGTEYERRFPAGAFSWLTQ